MRSRAVLLVALAAAPAAWANGAFPDSLKLLLAPDRPDELVLATNFGLVVSQDGGKSWRYHCEAELPAPTDLYERAAPPSRAILASGKRGLGVSRDSACTWQLATGLGAIAYDAFGDPSRPDIVFALSNAGPDARMSVHRSTDGARSFGAPLLVAASAEVLLSGVEVAPSDSKTIYVTANEVTAGAAPVLFSSTDEGATWTQRSLTPQLGARYIRLAAIDRTRPARLFLRVVDSGGASSEHLAISDDRGVTVRLAYSSKSRLTSFLQRSDGALLVGTLAEGLVKSTDDGLTFTPVAGAPRGRAIAERGGVTFVAGDEVRDGYSLARTTDDATWQVVLRFKDLCGPAECGASDKCTATWPDLARLLGVPPGTCGVPPLTQPIQTPKPVPPGCGCQDSPGAVLLLLLCPLVSRGSRQGRRRSCNVRVPPKGAHR